MVRRQCVCGAPLRGLHHSGPRMFGFVAASSMAHYNYDCEFEVGITLPGGRVLEQCEQCGSLTLCEYPTLDGSLRGEDPLITYGPGTVYEQCDIASVPVTYRSFRALMSSGVTGGILYSEAFKHNIAQLFGTTEQHLPSWKVIKDTLFDTSNFDTSHTSIDEWWFASIGRNFIVLYENLKVLRPVSAWRRIPHTAIKNADITRINRLNLDPLRSQAKDTIEMEEAHQELALTDERRQELAVGNESRLRLLQSSIHVGRTLRDIAQWVHAETMQQGSDLAQHDAVTALFTTAFGIRHACVHDKQDYHVDLLLRHDVLTKATCTCSIAQSQRICPHIVAVIFEMARRYQFRIIIPKTTHESARVKSVSTVSTTDTTEQTHEPPEQYQHYVDVVSLMREADQSNVQDELLLAFIEPFEQSSDSLYHVEFMAPERNSLGLPTAGYCIYSALMLSFIDVALQHGDQQYMHTLSRYGLDKDVHLSILNIEALDADLVRALITMAVHRDRRHEGYLAECLESGILMRLLYRLRDVSAEGGAAS